MIVKGENSSLIYLSRQVAVEATAAEPAASSANGEDEFHDDPPLVEQVIVASAADVQAERQLDRQQTGVAAQECEAQQVGLSICHHHIMFKAVDQTFLLHFPLHFTNTAPGHRPVRLNASSSHASSWMGENKADRETHRV